MNSRSQITPRDNLVIFTEHGMQANYRGDQFVVPILQRLGLCGPEHGSRTDGSDQDTDSRSTSSGRVARAVQENGS